MAARVATIAAFCQGLNEGLERKEAIFAGDAPKAWRAARFFDSSSAGEDSTRARWKVWFMFTAEIAVPTPPPTSRPEKFISVAPAAMARAALSSSACKTESVVNGLTPSLRASSAFARCTPRAPSTACVAPTFPSPMLLTVFPIRPKNLEAPCGRFFTVPTGSFTAAPTLWIFSPPDFRSALPNSADLFISRSEAMAWSSRTRLARSCVPVISSRAVPLKSS